MKSRRWVKRITIAALALVLMGGIYERVVESQYNRRFPQIEHSIDIGGRSLNIYCSGHGSPTVVMDSGHALPGHEWAAVQPGIAKFTTACWYDRAGFGWSDRADSFNTVDSMARDLHPSCELHRFHRRMCSLGIHLAAGTYACSMASILARLWGWFW
jgi:hypothetical protein